METEENYQFMMLQDFTKVTKNQLFFDPSSYPLTESVVYTQMNITPSDYAGIGLHSNLTLTAFTKDTITYGTLLISYSTKGFPGFIYDANGAVDYQESEEGVGFVSIPAKVINDKSFYSDCFGDICQLYITVAMVKDNYIISKQEIYYTQEPVYVMALDDATYIN